MDDTDRMVAWQLQNDPAFRVVFINGLAANLRGKPADEYDDAAPDERRRYAEQQLALFRDHSDEIRLLNILSKQNERLQYRLIEYYSGQHNAGRC